MRSKKYLKTTLSIIISLLLFSCSSTHPLLGKWESKQQIIQRFDYSRELHQGEWYYHTMEFKKNGNLIIGNYKSQYYDTVKYTLNDRTIKITANNGFVSELPILKINASELRTLDVADSLVTIYKKMK